MKRELLDNGNIWQKADGRWIGLVRYKDEFGVTQRKSFSSKKKKTLQAKMMDYVKNFNEQVANSDESKKPLKESMKNWLRVYKFPEVERTTYDRYECTDLSVHWKQARRRRHASRYQETAHQAYERGLRLYHEQESVLTAKDVFQATLSGRRNPEQSDVAYRHDEEGQLPRRAKQGEQTAV